MFFGIKKYIKIKGFTIILAILLFSIFWSIPPVFAQNLSEIAISNYSEILFDAHISIGEHYPSFGKFSDLVKKVKILKKYALDKSNVIYLSHRNSSFDKAVVPVVKKLIKESRSTQAFLKSKLIHLKDKELFCLGKKEFYDQHFFSSLEYLGGISMEESLLNSISSEQCATEARVYYNGYNELYKRLIKYTDLLIQRYDYWKMREKKTLSLFFSGFSNFFSYYYG